jgi:alpha-L-arabinofuranosidase
VDQLSLMPSDAIGVFDPAVVAMARDMHLSQLRFGGNFSSFYDWRNGIGPMDKRLTMKSIGWGIPEYNIFGTDEFLRFCRLIHTTPQFDLNMGTGTPKEAEAWVRYIDAHYKGDVIFELGNELYGRWQVGYPTPGELAAKTEAFSRAVRAVDPSATIIATGAGPVRFMEWNAAELTTPPGTFNDLSVHFIVGTNHAKNRNVSPGFLAAAAYAAPWAVGSWFDRMQAQVNSIPGMANKVHFAVTEWLFNSKGYGERNFTDESPSWLNEGGAVMTAGFFNTLLRHGSEIKIADMTGMMDFAGIWKKRGQVYASPAYYIFRMYSGLKNDSLLLVTSDSGTYSVTGGIAPLPDIKDVPYIDAVAARSADGNTITVFCINRDLNQAVSVHIDLGKFTPASTVRIEQISAASRYEENNEVEPERIVPVPATMTVHARQPITVVLPQESVTMLQVRRQP